MRTFHYAGVLTKDVDVLDVLNKQVSNTPDPQNSELALALQPELRFDKATVFDLASKLSAGGSRNTLTSPSTTPSTMKHS